MNPRHVSEADKIHNRQQRNARRNANKREARLGKIRGDVNVVMAAMLAATQLLTPNEAWFFQHGPARKARAVSDKIKYLSVLYSGDWPVLPQIADWDLKEVQPPIRRLQMCRRGRSLNVFRGAPVVLAEPPASEERPFRFLGPAAVELLSQGACRFRILQALEQRLRWSVETIIALLNTVEGFTPWFITDDLAAVTETLRYFKHFDESRTSYAAMVEAYGIAVARGDWGAYLPENLDRIRPGLKMPKHLQRTEYLARFVEVRDGEPAEVHFYSRSYLPLFRLPMRGLVK